MEAHIEKIKYHIAKAIEAGGVKTYLSQIISETIITHLEEEGYIIVPKEEDENKAE